MHFYSGPPMHLLSGVDTPPRTHIATRPGEVWCWDVTFLPSQMQGHWF